MVKSKLSKLMVPASMLCLAVTSVGCVDSVDEDTPPVEETEKNGDSFLVVLSNQAMPSQTFKCNEYFSCDMKIVATRHGLSDSNAVFGDLWVRQGVSTTEYGLVLRDKDGPQMMASSYYVGDKWDLPTIGPDETFSIRYEPSAQEANQQEGILFGISVEWR
mgnify:CR=1 FL=1